MQQHSKKRKPPRIYIFLGAHLLLARDHRFISSLLLTISALYADRMWNKRFTDFLSLLFAFIFFALALKGNGYLLQNQEKLFLGLLFLIYPESGKKGEVHTAKA